MHARSIARHRCRVFDPIRADNRRGPAYSPAPDGVATPCCPRHQRLLYSAGGPTRAVRADWIRTDDGTPVSLCQRARAGAGSLPAFYVPFLINLTFHASKMNRTEVSCWSVDFRYHAAPAALTGGPHAVLEKLRDRFRASGREPLTVLSKTRRRRGNSSGTPRIGLGRQPLIVDRAARPRQLNDVSSVSIGSSIAKRKSRPAAPATGRCRARLRVGHRARSTRSPVARRCLVPGAPAVAPPHRPARGRRQGRAARTDPWLGRRAGCREAGSRTSAPPSSDRRRSAPAIRVDEDENAAVAADISL